MFQHPFLVQYTDNTDPPKSARVVIFIDDLDRCEDDTIAKLLKEIKQHLSTRYCVFVFGYDRVHIENALSTTKLSSNKDARVYLEKLFQSTFYIKEPKEDNIKRYIKDQLEKYKIEEDLSDFIYRIIDPNPRKIKNFLNAFYFHYKMINKGENKSKKIALIAYLKLFYEPVYTALDNNNELLKSIIVVCKQNNRQKISSKEEYFIYLEFLSHFDFKEDTEIADNPKIMEYNKNIEEKFSREVYLMQGRHRSFANFKKEFANLFEDEENIESYL